MTEIRTNLFIIGRDDFSGNYEIYSKRRGRPSRHVLTAGELSSLKDLRDGLIEFINKEDVNHD